MNNTDSEFPLDSSVAPEKLIRYQDQYIPVKLFAMNEWNDLLMKYRKIPPKSKEIKWLVRHGIPMDLKSKCWFSYSGANELAQANSGIYALLSLRESHDISIGYTKDSNKILEFVAIIDGDINRTFPNHAKFSTSETGVKNQYLSSLRNVLVAFAYYSWKHPNLDRAPPKTCSYRIGYCQGLNFIVGILLLVFKNDQFEKLNSEAIYNVEESVFWTLVAIVEKLMPAEVYGRSLSGARIQQKVLWSWIIRERGEIFGLSDLSKWLKKIDKSNQFLSSFESITMTWFMNLYINILPIETAMRVLDCYFYQGEKILYRVAVSLLQLHQHEIVGFEEVIDACKYIKSLPKRTINSHQLLETAFLSMPYSSDNKNETWIPLHREQGAAMESTDNLCIRGSNRLSKQLIINARATFEKIKFGGLFSRESIG